MEHIFATFSVMMRKRLELGSTPRTAVTPPEALLTRAGPEGSRVRGLAVGVGPAEESIHRAYDLVS